MKRSLPDMHVTKLHRNEAAEYLKRRYGFKISTVTLACYASRSTGPTYRLAGRFPVYATDDLDDWAETRLSCRVRSPSELRASAA